MLDLGHDQRVGDAFWNQVELTARIPAQMTDFFQREGPLPTRVGCRRAYPRFYMRGKAILRWDEKYLGVYTVDASRSGIRFFSPIQLLPKVRVHLRLPKVQEFQVEVVRCCRLDECCYDCGAVFVKRI
jgi:PilZ domain